MTTTTIKAYTLRPRGWAIPRRRGHSVPWVALVIIGVVLFCAALAPWIAPYDPTALNIIEAKTPPFTDWAHPLGTDVLGRDMLSRLIYGAQTTVAVSMTALAAGVLIGTAIGLISGYHGGGTDMTLMRVTDAALGFPSILVAMIIMVFLGAGLPSIIFAVALTVWASFARMIRGEVLSIKQLGFVSFAEVSGVPRTVTIFRHIFPNTVNTLMIVTSLMVGEVILLEASLGFLGLGLPPGSPSWGIMVSEGRAVILDVWWLALFPGLAITALVLAFNSFGDWLRNRLDPKLRRAS